ncbi:MAG TPA: alkane 1-monooxygenase [Acetobacteraceae bacterium]
MLSALFGHLTHAPTLFASMPLLVAFVVVPSLTMAGMTGIEAVPGVSTAAWFHRLLPLGAVPAQIAALAVATEFWAHGNLGPAGSIFWLFSTGLSAALFGITVAHELIHRRSLVDRCCGGLLLSMSCFGAFKVVHLRVHHRYVGTSRDFASARRGDSIYAFWLRCLIASPREALRHDAARLMHQHRPLWQSELLAWYGLSLLWLLLSIAIWGWTGGLFFLLQSLVAILSLEWTNYVQHYGLRRHADANGRYEPIRSHHAWSMQCRISNFALLNLLRHGDHHTRPQEPYHALATTPIPSYPYPFGFMMLLALVTPLFRRVADPVLDRVAAAGG